MFFIYTLRWYNEYNEKEVIDHGLVKANNYAAAVSKITKDFGEDSMLSLDITVLDEDGATLSISEEIATMLLKENTYESSV